MPDSTTKMNDEKKVTEEQKATQQLDVEKVGGIACPIDPMERLQCDSCQ